MGIEIPEFNEDVLTGDESIGLLVGANSRKETLKNFGRCRFMGALATLAANKTAQNYSSYTAITFDSEVYDTDAFHDTVTNNDRLTIPSGLGITHVRLYAQTYFWSGTTGMWSALHIESNVTGYTWIPILGYHTSITDVVLSGGSPVIPCTAGDYFYLMASCSDTSITVEASNSYFGIEVVGTSG